MKKNLSKKFKSSPLHDKVSLDPSNENTGIDLPPSNLMREFILNIKEPTLIHHAIEDWTFLKWNLKDWSDAMNNSKVPFRVGQKTCSVNPQWERTCKTMELTIDEFASFTADENDEWMYFDYKYMNQWFKKSILQSVSWEAFGFPELHGEESTIWMGSKGAHTPCHSDSYGLNIIAQIYGIKMWVMFPPEATDKMKPTRVPYEESSVYSKINFYCGNSDYSSLTDAYFVVLHPGDVLIVPNQWWHYVKNITTAISINTWVPLETDHEKRLEESLVRNFILSAIQNLSTEEQKQILNPNEEILMNSSDTIDTDLINLCIEKCKQHKNDNNMSLTTKNSKNNSINLDNYTNIKTVKTKSMNEIINNLCDQGKCVNRKTENVSSFKQCNILEDYINAFCHPDVIVKVKEKILSNKQ